MKNRRMVDRFPNWKTTSENSSSQQSAQATAKEGRSTSWASILEAVLGQARGPQSNQCYSVGGGTRHLPSAARSNKSIGKVVYDHDAALSRETAEQKSRPP